MKTLQMVLLSVASLVSSAVRGQQTAEIQQVYFSLDNDPAFTRLSPQTQEWTRTMTNQLDAAVAQKNINAIGQWTPEETKRLMVGMTACGHVVDDGTFVDAVSLNASYQQAFVIRWLDPRGTAVHSAVFADGGRCVAKDGDVLDGKPIQRVLPNSLTASNQHGLIAWEAEYWNSPIEHAAGGPPHRGVFIENRFLTELDPRKASPLDSREMSAGDRDFQWNAAQETVTVKQGAALTSQATAKAAAPPCTAAAKRPGFLDKLKRKAPWKNRRQKRTRR